MSLPRFPYPRAHPSRPLAATALALACALASTPAVARRPVACPARTDAPPAEASLPPGLRAGEHQVVVNGVRLWYRVAGSGPAGAPPLVFLHGGPGYNSHSFSVLAGPRLECGVRMVYLDQRGAGRSERPWTREYSLALLVDDLEGVRRALGVEKIALLGHSFGGTLALEYAAKHPERVASLVLVNILFDAPAQCRLRRERMTAKYPEAVARVLADSAWRAVEGTESDCNLEFRVLRGDEREAYNNAVMFPDSTLRLLQDSVDAAGGLRNTGELSAALFQAGLLKYRFAAHDRLAIPVLVIGGRLDGAAGGPPLRALADALPNGRFVEYERAGHFPYLEEPERFARDVIGFVLHPPARRP